METKIKISIQISKNNLKQKRKTPKMFHKTLLAMHIIFKIKQKLVFPKNIVMEISILQLVIYLNIILTNNNNYM